VCQERLNDWYETRQTAFGKLDRYMYSNRKLCEKLPVNEAVETPVTCLPVGKKKKKLLHIKPAELFVIYRCAKSCSAYENFSKQGQLLTKIVDVAGL
jgi:hypothetical protein